MLVKLYFGQVKYYDLYKKSFLSEKRNVRIKELQKLNELCE